MKPIIATLSILTIFGLGLLSLNLAYPAEGKEPSCPNCPETKGMMMNPALLGLAAEMKGGMKGPGMMGEPGMMMEKPEFSPEQEKEILKLQMRLHKEIAPLRNDLATKETELQALWLEEKLDIEKIVKKVAEIHKLHGQIQEKEIRHQFEIYKILKPEQQKMFRRQHRMGFGPMERSQLRMGQMGCDCR